MKETHPPDSVAQLQQIATCFWMANTWNSLKYKAQKAKDANLLEHWEMFDELQTKKFHLFYYEWEYKKMVVEMEKSFISEVNLQKLDVDGMHKYLDERKVKEKDFEKRRVELEGLREEVRVLDEKWTVMFRTFV